MGKVRRRFAWRTLNELYEMDARPVGQAIAFYCNSQTLKRRSELLGNDLLTMKSMSGPADKSPHRTSVPAL